jgi:hypothetical protein
MIKNGAVEFATFSANRKGLALTNTVPSKQENVDRIRVKRSEVRINRKKYKNICFPKQGRLENLKPAATLN